MKREYSAGVIVYYQRNGVTLYLLLHYERGFWDLPKGHIEGKETKEQTALRELDEETGLKKVKLQSDFQENLSYFFHTSGTQELIYKTVYFFMGRSLTKKVTISHEHIGYMWLPYEEALKQLTYKNARSILKKVHRKVMSL